MVKIIACYSTQPRFNPQHSHVGLQLSVTPVSVNMISSDLRYQTLDIQVEHRYISKQNVITHNTK